MNTTLPAPIKIIVGLGNPGKQYQFTRHNIGFRVVDALADKYGASWQKKKDMEIAIIEVHGEPILLVKPQTFMNSSGNIMQSILKQGITSENMIVVHDELEKPFGNLTIKFGGSHKGHNGLRSIIASCGANFARLCFGIGRPDNKEDVPHYVLANFMQKTDEVEAMIEKAVEMLEKLL